MFAELCDQRKALIISGPGGVGKTTFAATIAIGAAMGGRRVALLSIDPAKRLADAIGIKIGEEMSRVKLKGLRESAFLDAGILDHKAVFDRMVHAYAKTPEEAEKILDHPLYQAASANMAGPLEYMALAKFRELYADPKYDLVVLDTPPDTQALDFLARPNILAGFVESKVLTWLLKPFVLASKIGLTAFFAVGEKVMGNIAAITGAKSLRILAEFLLLMQNVIKGFHQASEEILSILRQKSTGFVLIGTCTDSSFRSISLISAELKSLAYQADAIVFNRVLPASIREEHQRLNGSIHARSYWSSITRRLAAEDRIWDSGKRLAESFASHPFLKILHERDEPLEAVDKLTNFAKEILGK